MLLICGLGYYTIAASDDNASFNAAMARTSWFVRSTRRRLKGTEKGSSGTHSGDPTVLATMTDHNAALGAGLIATDPNEVRDPPPPPTPVTFPIYEALDSAHRIGRPAQTDFQSLFSKVTKPTDISKDHSEALNVEICYPCPVDQLLPPTPDGTSYLPPLAPQDAINAASYAEATKAEPAVSRKRKEFDDRLTELRVDNDTAYRTISRLLRNGAAARLAYMRKFWEGLEGMSQYWDCSLDQYFEAGTSSSNGEQSAKRQRLEIGEDGIDSSAFTPGLGPDDSNEQKLFSANVTPELQSRTRYKGRRTHTGRDMPDQFRADTVRAFVEGTVWPFQCSVAPPRQMPTVQFGRMNLPVRQTAVVYRLPNDRTRARQGRLEGPMIAIQARDENDFVGPNDQACEAKSRLDLMRELGGLLQLAQERRREGRTELKPGEGKWWTMRPRWGGGPGGEVENETGNSDIVQVAEELLNGIRDAKGRNDKDGSKTRKKKTPAVLWKELRCGSSRWDPVRSRLGQDSRGRFH